MGPATEMMVNDFDDERTLDEEEALEGSEDSHNELSNLQKVYLLYVVSVTYYVICSK